MNRKKCGFDPVSWTGLLYASAGLTGCFSAHAQGGGPSAPPTPPPIVQRHGTASIPPSAALRAAGSSTRFSIGEPSDEEQLYLELINRARSDPFAEGMRMATVSDPDILASYQYFGLNTNALLAHFATNAPVPPLSFNTSLAAAARRHSLDMLAQVFQAHDGSDGSTPGTRATDAGYPWTACGENVYAYSYNVLFGHAGFSADWGNGPDGMQSPPGHRISILSALFREVGISVLQGSNSKTVGTNTYSVGPQLVTQDFGSRAGLNPMITGVAYFDLNGNGFYDLGEGIGGLRVDTAGASYHAVTANSGGYTVPLPGNGLRDVTFSIGAQTLTQRTVTVSGGNNLKLDFVPAYQPALVSGSVAPPMGEASVYQFSPVLAATNYDWRAIHFATYPYLDGAETGGTNMSFSVSPSYPVITNSIKYAGTHSFHLAHPTPPTPQAMEVRRTLRPGTAAQLRFASRLGWALTGQVARVQISTNLGASWLDLWSQPGNGTNGPAETAFKLRTNSLAAYAGWDVRVRFCYDWRSGAYYPQTYDGVGWYVDEIAFSGVEEITSNCTNAVDAPDWFSLTPASTNRCELSVRALLPWRVLSFGPAWEVLPQPTPPRLRMLAAGGSLMLCWPTNLAAFVPETTEQVGALARWTAVAGTPSLQGSNYQMLVGQGNGTTFYRLRK